LGVARSGFYKWVHRPLSDRAIEDERILELIRDSYAASGGIYGSPRIFIGAIPMSEAFVPANKGKTYPAEILTPDEIDDPAFPLSDRMKTPALFPRRPCTSQSSRGPSKFARQ
jgi:hypothetical protein